MKRLDVTDPNVFDTWRKLYNDLTLFEQEQFGRDMEAAYPHQQSFTLGHYTDLLHRFASPRIIEIGGWKGELATACLEQAPWIQSWHNIDYCAPAVEKTTCKDDRYIASCPTHFHWFKDKREVNADLLIAAHVIEHLTDEDLESLILWIKGIPAVIFEAPIGRGESDWTGYIGTHILKMGWARINELMDLAGYKNEQISPHCYFYASI